jgi:hypothetical protein
VFQVFCLCRHLAVGGYVKGHAKETMNEL